MLRVLVSEFTNRKERPIIFQISSIYHKIIFKDHAVKGNFGCPAERKDVISQQTTGVHSLFKKSTFENDL